MTTPKGERRREAIATAAARITLSDGPAAVTHRRVAEEAEVPLAATTYYFNSRDDLLAAAGNSIVAQWNTVAERVADRAESPGRTRSCADDVIAALLPRRDIDIRGHYEHLVGAGRIASLADAYRDGRTRLNDAIARTLQAHGAPASSDLVIAVVDGAVVSALSEGLPVRPNVRRLLEGLLGGGG